MKTVPISGQFFTRFASADELNDHMDKHQILWDSVECPGSFPCLAHFHLDEHERPFPVFFTANDLEEMTRLLQTGNG